MPPYPKPRSPEKPPTPLQRRKRPQRRKRTVGTPKYFDKRWRALRAEVIADAGGVCQLDHPGCQFEARTVHHTRYGRGRGVKRLLVPKQFLVACCWACHRVEDPWLGDGPGLGSRDRNARKDAA